ncbi:MULTISPECIES: glucosylglycerol 3-phosphatase [unclassified Prochlorococcus]|uniref:glucosylglycerol 3-phosphatase n=1 Tax=unclassified Prochlorococcus TaxID=2627481 RepID=UPI000533AA95|nr:MULTISPECIES: glucosylglycerol 3-phosphatase [unclassified Prochlorococcus]KGG15111.1 putative glucosylglycerolphosphate phosphatasee [Prochlorococcus sp. MIT 0602]KGG17383.1 putative glucosylglycerolphosphate phosphatasee [Prochlorococcus sp. MIT 0603]
MVGANNINLINKILNCERLLIVQDIDGVCIPLVENPLKREINGDYVKAASKLGNSFSVLTCGEHEGRRGVNRIVERSLQSKRIPRENGLYLPGLAACGIEYQDRFGNIELLGLDEREELFLKGVPVKMRSLLKEELLTFMPDIEEKEIERQVEIAICDTRFSPAINLNNLFKFFEQDITKKIRLQEIMQTVMDKIIIISKNAGLKRSFYLHISPNLGSKNGREIIKFATKQDIGSTDIQLIINGALKEAGLLVLINKYIFSKTGKSPLGMNFNVREAPKSIEGLIELCKKNIGNDEMPTLIGVGDTITSTKDINTKSWLRGGSDRGFLTLIQRLGEEYQKNNQIIFVDSSSGEVDRPSVNKSGFEGITDSADDLKFNLVMSNGPDEYKEWFIKFSQARTGKHTPKDSLL